MQISEDMILFHWTNNGLYFPKILGVIWWKWWRYTNFCLQTKWLKPNDPIWLCDLRMFYQNINSKEKGQLWKRQ